VRVAEVRIDRAVTGFTVIVSLLSGLFFGTVPALQATGRATARALREGGRGILSGRGRRLRSAFVVAQMALAMVLLTGAGLLIHSFVRLNHVDPGFRKERALAFRVSLPESVYDTEPRRVAFADALMDRVRALPGVGSAAAIMALPLSGTRFSIAFEVKGRPPVSAAEQPSMETRVATAGYFETMGIPVLRGRGIERTDTAQSPQVVVLSASAARRYFRGEDPIGKWIAIGLGRAEGFPKPGGEVVGVVGDVKEFGLSKAEPPEIYIPYPQYPVSSMDVVLRTSVNPRSLVPAAASAVHGLDAEMPLARIRTLDEIVSSSVAEPRFYTLLLAVFAAMALSLAALGIYGVMAYAVAQRSREIGIRVALGAAPRGLRRMVLGQALGLTAAGVSMGTLGALALSRTLAGLIFDLSPDDPLTMACVALLLSCVGLLASYWPARQATRVDPLIALRTE
jgi:putative ABC transport system permease protein